MKYQLNDVIVNITSDSKGIYSDFECDGSKFKKDWIFETEEEKNAPERVKNVILNNILLEARVSIAHKRNLYRQKGEDGWGLIEEYDKLEPK